jgi:hypothetical protein
VVTAAVQVTAETVKVPGAAEVPDETKVQAEYPFVPVVAEAVAEQAEHPNKVPVLAVVK